MKEDTLITAEKNNRLHYRNPLSNFCLETQRGLKILPDSCTFEQVDLLGCQRLRNANI